MSRRVTCTFRVVVATGPDQAERPLTWQYVSLVVHHNTVGPKKKTKAQKEAERLQAEEDERKAEILRVKREAERVRKEAEDAKRHKEEQVCEG